MVNHVQLHDLAACHAIECKQAMTFDDQKARNIAGLHYPNVGRSGRKRGCIKPGIQFFVAYERYC